MTEEFDGADIEEVTISMTGAPGVVRENNDIPSREERNIDYGLEQYNKLRRKNRMIYVFNKQYLAFQENAKPEVVVDMAIVAAEPKITFRFAWVPALIAMGCFSIAVAKLRFQQSGADLLSFGPFDFQITIGLILAGLFFFMVTVFRTSYSAGFYTLNGEADLFQLYMNLPDNKKFQRLLNRLKESISQANKKFVNDEYRIAKEVEEHRHLYESKIISQQAYEQAKQKLFFKIK